MMPGHSVDAAGSPESENSRGHRDICASDGPWSPSRGNKREGLILKGAAKLLHPNLCFQADVASAVHSPSVWEVFSAIHCSRKRTQNKP